MRTNQEVFDSVMKWLNRDGASICVRSDGACAYYNPVNENRCAIGGDLPLHLAKELGDVPVGINDIITIDDATWEDEDYDVDVDVKNKVANFYDGINLDLLIELQRLHDDRDKWGAEGFIGHSTAEDIAHRYGLVYKYA